MNLATPVPTIPPAPVRTFDLDAPDAVHEALACKTCDADVLAVLENPDDTTVTLVTAHWVDCPTWEQHKADAR